MSKKANCKRPLFQQLPPPKKALSNQLPPTQPPQVIPTSHPCHVLSITFMLPPPSSGPSLGSLQPGSRGAQMALSDLDRCIFRQRSGDSSTSNAQRNRKCGRTTTTGNKYSEVVNRKWMNMIHDCLLVPLDFYLRKYETLSLHPNQQQNNITWPLLAQFEPRSKDIECCCQLQGGAWYLPQGGCT